MTRTDRQQERPGAEDAGRCQTQEAFRAAPEFAKEDAKPSQVGTPDETLRVFKDRNGVARAGLYPGTTPDVDDHWAHGEPMTDETDVAVARRLTGDDESETSDALLGIAYGRLVQAGKRDARVLIPTRLQPWAVRLDSTQARPTFEMATSKTSAAAAAAVSALDNAVRGYTANPMT